MANLDTQPLDYDESRQTFDWNTEWNRLDGLPGRRGLNIAHEAVDRHVLAGHGDRVAIRWLPRRGDPIDISYEELRRRTNHFANVIEGLGCEYGAGVATLTGRIPDLYVAALGALKAEAVFAPLPPTLGPEPTRQRLELGSIEILVTTPKLLARKVVPMLDRLPSLRHILVTGASPVSCDDPRVQSLDRLLSDACDDWLIPATTKETPALLHFTGGTTGRLKGVLHVHEAVLNRHISGSYVLDMEPDDVFWCTADPSWATGMFYGVISPLTHGVTNIVDEGELDADRWYSVLDEHKVNLWCTEPAALQTMLEAGLDAARSHDLSSLRLLASVGESLSPEAVRWGQDVFGVPILDNWSQTETGGIMIANHRSQAVRPGSTVATQERRVGS